MNDEKRKEVLDLLLKGCSTERVIESNLPINLYKYRAGNTWDLDALENDSIWMGNAVQMDDSFDSKLLLTEEFKEKIEYMTTYNDYFQKEKYKLLLNDDAIQNDCYICSLSEISDSEDMWKRYADNDKGFCIEYNTKELLTKLEIPLLPVYYGEKCKYDEKILSDFSKTAMIFENFLVKHKVGINGEDWYSQREWRIIAFSKNLSLSESNKNGKCIHIIKPTKIIMGRQIADTVKRRIISWKEKDDNEDVFIVQR